MNKILLAITALTLGLSAPSFGDAFSNALTGGEASGDFRLRFEESEQDNTARDASALTLRSRLGYTTGSLSGFSATLEVEDVRIVGGVGDYTVGPTGYNPGEFSVIADPEVTEIDQGFIQYKQDQFSARLGRQVITHDGHRFIGHVGWRQDRLTFDAASIDFSPLEGATISYAYIDQRNMIFAEAADMDSSDHLLNASLETPVGKVVLYRYLLEVDKGADNALDTFGASLTGRADIASVTLLYAMEYAKQDFETGATENDADYRLLEIGAVVSGVTGKLGQETLGSDDGLYGFSTPLATLHKFNGWADIFLGTPAAGLVDTYASVSGKLFGGAWMVAYHEFKADEDTPTMDDFGDELDISYAKKFGKHYTAGIKYAAYNARDFAVDTDKLWVWVGLSF